MESANTRLDELVAFGAGFASTSGPQHVLSNNELAGTTNQRFPIGRIDQSRFVFEHVETGNPQAAVDRTGFEIGEDFILQVFGILLWIENCDGGYDYGFDRILAVVSICLYCCYHSRMMKAGCYKLI